MPTCESCQSAVNPLCCPRQVVPGWSDWWQNASIWANFWWTLAAYAASCRVNVVSEITISCQSKVNYRTLGQYLNWPGREQNGIRLINSRSRAQKICAKLATLLLSLSTHADPAVSSSLALHTREIESDSGPQSTEFSIQIEEAWNMVDPLHFYLVSVYAAGYTADTRQMRLGAQCQILSYQISKGE